MPHIILPPAWRIPESEATPETLFSQSINRRSYLKLLGLGAFVLTGDLSSCSVEVSEERFSKSPKNYKFSNVDREVYPAKHNPLFTLDRQMTAEHVAAQYNNFYEFSEAKDDIWKRVGPFQPRLTCPL